MTTISDTNYNDHIEQALSLDADGYATLLQFRMIVPNQPDTILYLTPQKSVNWQGVLWQNWAFNITGYKMDSSEEASRPQLSVVNPDGVFSAYIHQGMTDNAEVTRYRVLGEHLNANINSFVKNVWRVAKTVSLTKQLAVLELRGCLDGQMFMLPARQYIPPEFDMVSL